MHEGKLTICITTYNRYPYLVRLLNYLEEYGGDFKIVVLDSSVEKTDDPSFLKILKSDNVSWLKYDPSIVITEKISNGLSEVDSEFSVLCADDDFLIPNSLRKCINFLKNNQDYTSAHGIYCFHNAVNKNNKISWDILYALSRSNSSDNSLKRFKNFFPKNYSSYPFYALHRTADLKNIWNTTYLHCKDWGWNEILPSCLSIIKGKSKKLKLFYASRQPNDTIAFDEERLKSMYSEEKNKEAFLAIKTELDKNSPEGYEDLSEMIHDQFTLYRKLSDRKIIKSNGRLSYYYNNPAFLFPRFLAFILKQLLRLRNKKDLEALHRLLVSESLSSDIIVKSRKSY